MLVFHFVKLQPSEAKALATNKNAATATTTIEKNVSDNTFSININPPFVLL
jgi:hypothetical protein